MSAHTCLHIALVYSSHKLSFAIQHITHMCGVSLFIPDLTRSVTYFFFEVCVPNLYNNYLHLYRDIFFSLSLPYLVLLFSLRNNKKKITNALIYFYTLAHIYKKLFKRISFTFHLCVLARKFGTARINATTKKPFLPHTNLIAHALFYLDRFFFLHGYIYF